MGIQIEFSFHDVYLSDKEGLQRRADDVITMANHHKAVCFVERSPMLADRREIVVVANGIIIYVSTIPTKIFEYIIENVTPIVKIRTPLFKQHWNNPIKFSSADVVNKLNGVPRAVVHELKTDNTHVKCSKCDRYTEIFDFKYSFCGFCGNEFNKPPLEGGLKVCFDCGNDIEEKHRAYHPSYNNCPRCGGELTQVEELSYFDGHDEDELLWNGIALNRLCDPKEIIDKYK